MNPDLKDVPTDELLHELTQRGIMKELTALRAYRRRHRKQFSFNKLKTFLHGALKATINAHGPITKQYINSAVKRCMGEWSIECQRLLEEADTLVEYEKTPKYRA